MEGGRHTKLLPEGQPYKSADSGSVQSQGMVRMGGGGKGGWVGREGCEGLDDQALLFE